MTFQAKRWRFSTRDNVFSVETEGEASGDVTLAARIAKDLDFESDPDVVRVDRLAVTINGTPVAGDTIQGRLYVDGELIDTMSIGVAGAKCPNCGCEFTL
jgi:hypothetical protein